ncbi:hypothetical protein FRB91_003373 [Serendipita sp. 411]|nr:hypothetical protein FRC16_011016 [Serendipita sp. 398]KAG8843412.1 hypothetical protein FRB91_003373 [Serendipita sp. 411]
MSMLPTAAIEIFPVEIWRVILADAVFEPLLPKKNATVFEDIDVFGHPCKLFRSQQRTRATLRLVCRLWSEIIQSDRRYGAIFVDSVTLDKTLSDDLRLACRLEVINRWDRYCCKWPCALTRRRTGRCPFGSYAPPKYEESAHQKIQCTSGTCIGANVLRLRDDVRNPDQLLMECRNLRALSVRFTGFRAVTSERSLFAQQYLQHLSHLELDGVRDTGEISILDLPRLTYIKLIMHLMGLGPGGIGIFPLEIQMPNVATILLDGWIDSKYSSSVETFLLSCTDSLINLLLTYNSENGHAIFSLANLPKFKQLSTFGFGIRNLYRPMGDKFGATPLPSSSSFSFVILGLDAHNRKDCFRFRKLYVDKLTDVFTRPGKWISKFVIPLEWAELQDLWVQACEKLDPGDGFNEDDPLPCYWYVLDRMDRNDLPIQDRNGVGLGEGPGLIFAERMREYSGGADYTKRRWSFIAKECKNWNRWDYRRIEASVLYIRQPNDL